MALRPDFTYYLQKSTKACVFLRTVTATLPDADQEDSPGLAERPLSPERPLDSEE